MGRADAQPRRVSVVTGATSGIGREIARALASRGDVVVGVGRDSLRCAGVEQDLRLATGNASVHLLRADLSAPEEVRGLAEEVGRRWPRLDLLVNNAGAMFARREVTEAGFERTLAVNFLAPFLLTNLLRTPLQASTPSRVVNVSSEAHRGVRLDPETLLGDGGYGRLGWPTYQRSKLALMLWSAELARRLDGSGVVVATVHPGRVATGFPRKAGLGLIRRLWIRLGADSVARGAAAVVAAATSERVGRTTGLYWVNGEPAEPSREAMDPSTAARLWVVATRATSQPDR